MLDRESRFLSMGPSYRAVSILEKLSLASHRADGLTGEGESRLSLSTQISDMNILLHLPVMGYTGQPGCEIPEGWRHRESCGSLVTTGGYWSSEKFLLLSVKLNSVIIFSE